MIYNSFNISLQVDFTLGCFFPECISNIEWRDDMRFADRNLLQKGSKKTGSVRKKCVKVSATLLALL